MNYSEPDCGLPSYVPLYQGTHTNRTIHNHPDVSNPSFLITTSKKRGSTQSRWAYAISMSGKRGSHKYSRFASRRCKYVRPTRRNDSPVDQGQRKYTNTVEISLQAQQDRVNAFQVFTQIQFGDESICNHQVILILHLLYSFITL